MNDLYPFTGHYLNLDGIRLHYLDEGAGDPIVMVHGNPTWSFYYRNAIQGLRDHYRCIAPDHVGCGHSDKPGDGEYPYRLERRVYDLERLIDSLRLDRPLTLLVHDWGGMIGMAYAAHHPERIGRLIVLNTGAFRIPAGKRLPWSIWACRNTPFGPLLVRGFNAFCKGAVRYCVTRKPLSPEVRAGYLAPYDNWDHRRAVLRFVQDIPLSPSDPSYRLVQETEDRLTLLKHVPMLICWGDRDFVFDHHFLGEWRKHFPNAEVHQFADAGHYVLEDAGEEVLKHVQRFLSHHPLATAKA